MKTTLTERAARDWASPNEWRRGAQRAAPLYLRAGKRIAGKQMVGGRNRPAYAQAAETLQHLMTRVGKAQAQALIQTHLPEYQKLPALRDEMQKAGLF